MPKITGARDHFTSFLANFLHRLTFVYRKKAFISTTRFHQFGLDAFSEHKRASLDTHQPDGE
jgi:hypothetical protein